MSCLKNESLTNDEDGMPPLHIAVKNNHEKTVVILLELRLHDVNAKFKDQTPLHIAVKNKKEKIIAILLKNGADVNAKFKDQTPLHIAVQSKKKKIVAILLEYDPDVNAKFKDQTSLHIAVKNKMEKIVTILLEKGADVNVKSKGHTPLYVAAEMGLPSTVEDILKYEPDIDDESNKNSFRATIKSEGLNYRRILRALLSYYIHFNFESLENRDLLHFSIENGYEEFVVHLINRGVSISTLSKQGGCTLLHTAAKFGQTAIVEILLNAGCDVNVRDDYRRTALSYAVENLNVSIEILLITHVHPISSSASFLAVKKKFRKCIAILVGYNADVNAEDIEGNTILHTAIFPAITLKVLQCKHTDAEIEVLNNATVPDEEIVRFLLNKGANVYINRDGMTPLYCAVFYEFTNVVNIILEHRANSNGRRVSNIASLHYALVHGYIDIIIALLEHDANVSASDIVKLMLPSMDRGLIAIGNFMYTQPITCILTRYIVRFKVLGQPVYEQWSNCPAHNEIEDACLDELQSMKERIIGKSKVSFYDFFTETKQDKYLGHCRNLAIVQAFNSNCESIYPEYGRMIKLRFLKGKERNNLMQECWQLFPLSPELIDMILSHLSVKDLRNLLKACEYENSDGNKAYGKL